MSNTLVYDAFHKWRVSEEGAAFRQAFPAGAANVSYMFAVFKAGWNAARAEARSDASQPAGGRSVDRADVEGR
jgi:hypothetical protein